MQHEIISPINGNRLKPALPFMSPDLRLSYPPYITNGGDYIGLYSSFSPKGTPLPGSRSVSLTPSSVSFDEEDPAFIETNLYLARLTLQFQEISERYDLCLSHLQETIHEMESLRKENAQLRIANGELTKRLSLLYGNQNDRIAASAAAMSIVNEFRRLSVAEPPAESSPTSVLGYEENRFGKREPEKRVSLPKSISVRSSGFLKLNSAGGNGRESNRNGRTRGSSPVKVGSPKRVYVGGAIKKEAEEEDKDEEEEALELDVYNQGMFKTELCNKWEENGECPYGEHCQFAHGIAELRPVIRHPRYKTEVCRMVLTGDTCPYGHRCHFRHALTPHDRLLLRST